MSGIHSLSASEHHRLEDSHYEAFTLFTTTVSDASMSGVSSPTRSVDSVAMNVSQDESGEQMELQEPLTSSFGRQITVSKYRKILSVLDEAAACLADMERFLNLVGDKICEVAPVLGFECARSLKMYTHGFVYSSDMLELRFAQAKRNLIDADFQCKKAASILAGAAALRNRSITERDTPVPHFERSLSDFSSSLLRTVKEGSKLISAFSDDLSEMVSEYRSRAPCADSLEDSRRQSLSLGGDCISSALASIGDTWAGLVTNIVAVADSMASFWHSLTLPESVRKSEEAKREILSRVSADLDECRMPFFLKAETMAFYETHLEEASKLVLEIDSSNAVRARNAEFLHNIRVQQHQAQSKAVRLLRTVASGFNQVNLTVCDMGATGG